jgi:Asp/Glu/hydantoin racemase
MSRQGLRILVVNPNTSPGITAIAAAAARRAAAADTQITAVTAPFGARYIGSRSENAIAGPAVLAAATAASGSQRVGMATILVFFIVGLWLLWREVPNLR